MRVTVTVAPGAPTIRSIASAGRSGAAGLARALPLDSGEPIVRSGRGGRATSSAASPGRLSSPDRASRHCSIPPPTKGLQLRCSRAAGAVSGFTTEGDLAFGATCRLRRVSSAARSTRKVDDLRGRDRDHLFTPSRPTGPQGEMDEDGRDIHILVPQEKGRPARSPPAPDSSGGLQCERTGSTQIPGRGSMRVVGSPDKDRTAHRLPRITQARDPTIWSKPSRPPRFRIQGLYAR